MLHTRRLIQKVEGTSVRALSTVTVHHAPRLREYYLYAPQVGRQVVKPFSGNSHIPLERFESSLAFNFLPQLSSIPSTLRTFVIFALSGEVGDLGVLFRTFPRIDTVRIHHFLDFTQHYEYPPSLRVLELRSFQPVNVSPFWLSSSLVHVAMWIPSTPISEPDLLIPDNSEAPPLLSSLRTLSLYLDYSDHVVASVTKVLVRAPNLRAVDLNWPCANELLTLLGVPEGDGQSTTATTAPSERRSFFNSLRLIRVIFRDSELNAMKNFLNRSAQFLEMYSSGISIEWWGAGSGGNTERAQKARAALDAFCPPGNTPLHKSTLHDAVPLWSLAWTEED